VKLESKALLKGPHELPEKLTVSDLSIMWRCSLDCAVSPNNLKVKKDKAGQQNEYIKQPQTKQNKDKTAKKTSYFTK
jgi:hypothetical protein